MINRILAFTFLITSVSLVMARENTGIPGGKVGSTQKLEAGDCVAATSSIDLDINNVTVHFFKEEWEEFLELMKPLT